MIPQPKKLVFTKHAEYKMQYYRLSPQRVKSVMFAPRRVEVGIAPKTIAMMQPASIKYKSIEAGVLAPKKKVSSKYGVTPANSGAQVVMPAKAGTRASSLSLSSFSSSQKTAITWSSEIWVMVQDIAGQRKVISAWRYPGVTKPRDELTRSLLRDEYQSFAAAGKK